MESFVRLALLAQLLLVPAQASESPARRLPGVDGVTTAALRGAAAGDVEAESFKPGDIVQDYALFMSCVETPLLVLDLMNDCAAMFPTFACLASLAASVLVCIGHCLIRCCQFRRREKKQAAAESKEHQVLSPGGRVLTKFRAPGGSAVCADTGKTVQYVWGVREEKFYLSSAAYKARLAEQVELKEGPLQLNVPAAVGARLSQQASIRKEPSYRKEEASVRSVREPAESPEAPAPEEAPAAEGAEEVEDEQFESPYGAIGARVSQRASNRMNAVSSRASQRADKQSSYQATAGRRRQSPPPGASKDGMQRKLSNASDFSEMSDVPSDFDGSDGQSRSPSPSGRPRGGRAGGGRTRNRRGGEDIVVEFQMTVRDVQEQTANSNLDDWFEEKIREQGREKGLSQKQMDKMLAQENVELIDAQGGKYKSMDELNASVTPDLFPITFRYFVKGGKRRAQRLGEDDLDKKMGAPIQSTSSGRRGR